MPSLARQPPSGETPPERAQPSKLEPLFSIDLRSLALFRVSVGLLLLADLAVRAGDLVAHYTDLGVLPVEVLRAHPHGRLLRMLSLHTLHGSESFQAALFLLAAASAVALVLGIHTRWAALLSWLLLLSLQHRNPLVIYGGDNALAVVLFWCLFVPLGARASVDARQGRGRAAARVFSWGSAGLLLQVAAIHWFSVFHKRSPEWILDGTAVAYALHMDHLVRPLGVVLREHELLLRGLTHGTMLLELVGPLLLFSPWRFVPLRMLTIGAFVGLHLGIGTTLHLLHFSWISVLTMSVFLPPWFWEVGLPRLAALGRRPRELAPPDRDARVPGLSRPARVLAVGALAFVLAWNTVSLHPGWSRRVESNTAIQWLLLPWQILRLGQVWAMFAPHPPKFTRWDVLEGQLEDGRRVDLLWGRETPPSFRKPARKADYFPSGRWERIFANAPTSEYVDPYRALARYYCRGWGRVPGRGRLVSVSHYALSSRTRLGAAAELLPPRRLARFRCAGLRRVAPADAGTGVPPSPPDALAR
ncbi:MAG: HTTM domain-containing protein [Myxococcota bacterium]